MKKVLAFLIIALAAWPLAAYGLAKGLMEKKDVVGLVDAIVVFSGSRAFRERGYQAAELYKRGLAKHILLTDDGEQGGWSTAKQRNPYFVEMASERLQQMGVTASSIEIVPLSARQLYPQKSRARMMKRSLYVVWPWSTIFGLSYLLRLPTIHVEHFGLCVMSSRDQVF